MPSLRKIWLTLLCLGTVCAFFGQTTICLAADTALIGCEESGDHHDRDTTSGAPCAADHCSHCASHTSLLPAAAPAIVERVASDASFAFANDSAPEGPVREVDYPPQLS